MKARPHLYTTGFKTAGLTGGLSPSRASSRRNLHALAGRTEALEPGLIIGTALATISGVFFPATMFVALLHETSHGLAAVLTGGSFQQITMHLLGGWALVSGGSEPIVSFAGYAGALLLSAVLFALVFRTKSYRLHVSMWGVVVLVVTSLFVRPLWGGAFTLFLALGAAFVLVGTMTPERWLPTLAKVLSLSFLVRADADIVFLPLATLLFGKSDMADLAKLTEISAAIWYLAWLALAVVASLLAFRVLRD